MKVKFFLIGLFMFGMSSCAYKTCPTYAEKEVKTQQVEKTEILTARK